MATYSILGKRLLARYIPWTVLLYAFAFGGLFLVLGSGAGMLRAAHYSTATWAWILFGETLTATQLLGAGLVCAGIAWIQRAR